MNSNTKPQFFAAYTAFIISGTLLYNPLYKTSHKIFVSTFTVILALCVNLLCLNIFNKKQQHKDSHSIWGFAVGILFTLFASTLSALYLKEFMQACAMFSRFYTSEGISFVFTALIIALCAFAGYKSTGSLMRLCSLLIVPYVLYYISLFFSLITLKGICTPNSISVDITSVQALSDTLYSTLFICCDISVFLFCAISENKTHKNVIKVTTGNKAFMCCIAITLINVIRTTLSFGNVLSCKLYSCDLTALQLLPSISFSEIYLFLSGFGCIVKLCIYLYAASQMLLFGKNKNSNLTSVFLPALATFIIYNVMQKIDSKHDFSSPLFAIIGIGLLVLPIICLYLPKNNKKSSLNDL